MSGEQQTLSEVEMNVFLRLRALTGCPVRMWTAGDVEHANAMSGLLERAVVTGLRVSLPGASLLTEGQSVHVEILAREALLEFDCEVTYVDGVGSIELNLPEEVDVLQRRRHSRVEVQLESMLEVDSEPDPLQVQVINLSVGGAACTAPLHLRSGTQVLLHLQLSSLAPAELPATVVRATAIAENTWVLGLAFKNPNPAQEVKVAQYIASALAE